MTNRTAYQCSRCGKRRDLPAQAEAEVKMKAPSCCGRSMVPAGAPLPVCETSFTAEHSRLEDDGGPCDDGRSG